MTRIYPDNDVAELVVNPAYACLNIKSDTDLAVARGTEFLDGEVVGGRFSHQVKADAIQGIGSRNSDEDVTQLLYDEVPGHQFVLQVEVDDIPGAKWNDPDNDVKGSKDNPQDQVPQVQVE